jgi:hypothetical protein
MSGISNYEPYAPNNQGLTEALIDLKSTMAEKIPYSVAGFQALAFENINQGEALYARSSDGKVGRAIANDTFDKANVIGFAQTTKLSGELVRVSIVGVAPNSGLSPGAIYYLSAVSAGTITSTPPSTAGHYVTRVGEAASAAELTVQLEPPILLA